MGLPSKVSPEQLRDVEEFQKVTNLLAVNQIKLASNAWLDLAVHSNPNLTMSRYGREAIIAVLQGNVDWQDRLRAAWLASGLPANQYDRWANEAQKSITPHIFQFSRMDPTAQRQFYNDLISSGRLEDFKTKYNLAVRQGWVGLPKKRPPTEEEVLEAGKRRPGSP